MSKSSKRKAMRSGNAICPISQYRGALVQHHINGRDIPRWDQPWNVVWVSPNVHDEIHRGIWVIERWVKTTAGRELMYHKAGEDSITGDDATPPLY